MNEIDRYVGEVLRRLPASPGVKARIEADLRAHFEEATAAGESPAAITARLGTPDQVAEEYIATRGLVYAGFWRRAAAFLVDLVLLTAIALPTALLVIALANMVPRSPSGVDYFVGGTLIVLVVSLASILVSALVLYFPILEGRFGQTLGKRLLGMRVLKESGLPIGFKEGFLRRLPFYFDFWPIDALFVPFTKKRQRAFDIVARTVVIEESGDHR